MRYAQLNPKNLVMNILVSEDPRSGEFVKGAHFSHEEMWNHAALAVDGKAAPMVALPDGVTPIAGQRWDGGLTFVDDAEWLQSRAEQFVAEAEEQGRSVRIATKDLKAAQADPDLKQDVPYYQGVLDAAKARVKEAQDKAADYAARAKAAK